MMNPAIRIKELSKNYILHSKTRDVNLVLDNISFSIDKGKVIGLTGKNGSGKTTLLRIMAGLTTPSSGTIEISGRMLSIIELGSGFHPDLNGYDNILYYGQILGYDSKYVKEKIESIAVFSEIGGYLQEPVKTYSKGMYLRLAYSVIVHMEADIYLFDEVFAVGDKYFKEKCIKNILDLKSRKKTILITGHDFELISSVCDEIIVIENGNITNARSSNNFLFHQLHIDTDISVENVQVTEDTQTYILSFSLNNIDASYKQVDIILIAEHNNNSYNRFVIEVQDSVVHNLKAGKADYQIYLGKKYFHPGEHALSVHVIKNKKEVTRNFPFISVMNIPVPDSENIQAFYPGPIHIYAENKISVL